MNKNHYHIGLDVGGTNTDAALLEGDRVLNSVKVQTSNDVTNGVLEAISLLLKGFDVENNRIHHISLGTTHLLNAMLTRKLVKVVVVRLGAPASTAIPPAAGWPRDDNGLFKHFIHESVVAKGGYEYNGKEISPLDERELIAIALKASQDGVSSIAITGIFSPINPKQELQAEAVLKKANKNLYVSLSHRIGGLTLLERENANILNACLFGEYLALRHRLVNLGSSLNLGYSPRVFLSCNDGTLDELLGDKSIDKSLPVLSLNSGVANSMYGAQLLAPECLDAIVVDIGGTSTDIGAIKDGKVMEFNRHYLVEGVQVNLRSAFVTSISLGGGTKVVFDNNEVKILSESVKSALKKEALVFGGQTCTLTDVAVANKQLELGDAKYLAHYSNELWAQASDAMHQKLLFAINEFQSQLRHKPKTIIFVGGGGKLIDHTKFPGYEIILPKHYNAANAVGAGLAKITAHAEIFFCNTSSGAYEKAKKEIYILAKEKIIDQGADPNTVTELFIEKLPMTYLQNAPTLLKIILAARISMTAQSTLKESVEYRTRLLSDSPILPKRLTVSATQAPNTPMRSNIVSDNDIKKDCLSSEVPGVCDIDSSKFRALTLADVHDLKDGAALLGSGGGGDPYWCYLMIQQLADEEHKIHLIDPRDLPDNAWVGSVIYGGSPAIAAEKLFSENEVIAAIEQMQRYYGRKMDALIHVEGGGANAMSALCAAAKMGIPVVDGDFMGRAFPGIQHTTIVACGDQAKDRRLLSNALFSISCGTKSYMIRSNFIETKGADIHSHITDMAGSLVIVPEPMTGEQVKRLCFHNTLSVAQKIGSALRLAKEGSASFIDVLNKALLDTAYGQAKSIITGKIIYCPDYETNDDSKNEGSVLIEASNGHYVELGYRNEFLIAKSVKRTFGQKAHDIRVPDILSLLDATTMGPVFAHEVRFGQQVTLISIKAPELMYSKSAQSVFGAEQFDTDELLKHAVRSPVSPRDQLITGHYSLDVDTRPKPQVPPCDEIGITRKLN